jgi:type II secretory pathway component PulF
MIINKKYRHIIAVIALIPLVLAFLAFFVIPSIMEGQELKRFIEVFFNIIKISYYANILVILIILLSQKRNYSVFVNIKKTIFLFIPFMPLAINLIIGFNLKLKDKSLISTWSILNLFGWGDIYKKP